MGRWTVLAVALNLPHVQTPGPRIQFAIISAYSAQFLRFTTRQERPPDFQVYGPIPETGHRQLSSNTRHGGALLSAHVQICRLCSVHTHTPSHACWHIHWLTSSEVQAGKAKHRAPRRRVPKYPALTGRKAHSLG